MKKSLLFNGASKWSAGLNLHSAALGLVHYSAASIQSDLGSAQQTELTFQATRSVTLAASNAMLTARAGALLYVEQARTVLRTYLGERWSTTWTQAGFINHSLRLPTNTAGVLGLLRALQAYFTSHAAQQNTLVGVTAVAAGPLITTLDNTQKALDTAKCAQRAKRDARDAAEKTLLDHLRGSRSEVESVLPPEDARWLDFRDSIPGDLRSPEAVAVFEVRPGLPGHLSAHWLDSLRADRFVLEAAVGAATEFTAVQTVRDTVADLEFPPGVEVRLRVRARNAAGDSGPSPVVTILVPTAATEAVA